MLELVAKKSVFRPGPTSRPRLFALGLLVVVLSSLGLTVSAHAAAAPAAALEHYVHELVNGHRTTLGLTPFALIPEISDIARVHSRDMATGRLAFSHVGLDGRAAEISKSIPYRAFSENIAFNNGLRTPGMAAVGWWLESPGHRRNIEGSFALTGIGIARTEDGTYFFTQLFVNPAPSPSVTVDPPAVPASVPPPAPEPAHSTEAQPPPAEVDAAPSLFAQLAGALLSLAGALFDLAWDLLFGLAGALFAPAPPAPHAPAIAVDPPAATPAAVPLPAPEPAHSTEAQSPPAEVDPPPQGGVPPLAGPLAAPAALTVPPTLATPPNDPPPPAPTARKRKPIRSPIARTPAAPPQTIRPAVSYNIHPRRRPEKDPRGRPGRRRTTDGWVQKLE